MLRLRRSHVAARSLASKTHGVQRPLRQAGNLQSNCPRRGCCGAPSPCDPRRSSLTCYHDTGVDQCARSEGGLSSRHVSLPADPIDYLGTRSAVSELRKLLDCQVLVCVQCCVPGQRLPLNVPACFQIELKQPTFAAQCASQPRGVACRARFPIHCRTVLHPCS